MGLPFTKSPAAGDCLVLKNRKVLFILLKLSYGILVLNDKSSTLHIHSLPRIINGLDTKRIHMSPTETQKKIPVLLPESIVAVLNVMQQDTAFMNGVLLPI
jgi:hypothetical protein